MNKNINRNYHGQEYVDYDGTPEGRVCGKAVVDTMFKRDSHDIPACKERYENALRAIELGYFKRGSTAGKDILYSFCDNGKHGLIDIEHLRLESLGKGETK